VLFYEMEKNTVREHYNYLEYKQAQASENITTCVNSITMSTQFFLSDTLMEDALNTAMRGETMSAEELIEFQSTDIKNLQRIVYNNPLMYSVRIYSVTDNVQEMMPILYTNSRMNNLAWAAGTEDASPEGWHFGYYDTAFSSLSTSQDKQILSHVTKFDNYEYGTVGYIEAAVTMEQMFPVLFENKSTEWSCYVDENGNYFFGSEAKAENLVAAEKIIDNFAVQENEIYYDKDNCLLITVLPVSEFGGYLVTVDDIREPVQYVHTMRNIFVMVVLILLIILSFFINMMVRRMLRQLYLIIDSMKKVEEGDLSTRIEKQTKDEMGLLGDQLNRMLDRIEKLMKENVDREVLVKNSEIRALQNQINAHFIYNVLESIKMMAEIDEEYEISDAITALGKLLRYSMRWVSGNVSLREELEYIKNYLILINLRYDFTVILSLNIKESMMDQELPKMSLQPIVENAVLHGIEPTAEDATIYIKGWYEDDECIIEITDAGTGMTDQEFEKLQHRMQGAVEPTGGKSNGIGLKNVHDRIQMAFGKKYGLTFATKLGCFTKVAVRLPRKDAMLNSATDRKAVKQAALEQE